MENNSKELIDVTEASQMIGVSVDTLRRWDANGKLAAIRPGGKGSHRLYRRADLEVFLKDLFFTAKAWVSSEQPYELESTFYCSNSNVFQGRLSTMETLLQNNPLTKEIFSLITAVTGEIGNNSFDHNLGSWPDIGGIFFAHDITKRIIVLADRGRGILSTLQRVKLELKDHESALKTAFTEVVTGRAPEHRGNGLKFVRKAILQSQIGLNFQTGNAKLSILPHSEEIHLGKAEDDLRGCLAFIRF